MNVALSPSQMEKLVKNTVNQHLVVYEQDGGESTANAQPKTGTSSKQTGGTGYPEVGKWESGIERGPANQVAVTKWSDVVGSKLQRGKANQLKEQVENINPKNLKFGDGGLKNPNQVNDVKVLQQKLFDGGFLKTDTMKPTGYFGPLTKSALEKYQQTQKTPAQQKFGNPADIKTYPSCVGSETSNKNRAELIKSQSGSYFINIKWLPGFQFYNNNRVMKPNRTMGNYSCSGRDILIDGIDVKSQEWKKIKDKYTTDYEKNELKKIQQFGIDSKIWDEWGQWVLMGGSILAAMFIPGAQGLWISIGLDVIAAIDLYVNKKDNFGAGIAGILAFVPVIGNIAKVGKVSVETAEKLAKIFAPLKTEEEVLNTLSKLPKQEQYIVQQILKQDPKTLNNIIKGIVTNKVTTKQEALRVATQINNLLKSGKLPKASAEAFYKNLNFKRFGFDLGVSGIIYTTGEIFRYYFNKKSQEMIRQGMEPPASDVEIAKLAEKVDKMNRNDFEEKIVPIFNKYGEIYDVEGASESQLNKLRKIQKTVLSSYIKNPKVDLNVIASETDRNSKN